MHRKRRVWNLLLSVAACLLMLPMQAGAVGVGVSARQGTAKIGSGVSQIQKNDTVYMGTYGGSDIPWRVLDPSRTNAGGAGMFLITQNIYDNGKVQFEEDYQEVPNPYDPCYKVDGNGNLTDVLANVYTGSLAQTWCNNFRDNNLSLQERASLIAISKTDTEYSGKVEAFGSLTLTDEKVFFLSAREAEADGYFTSKEDRIVNDNTGTAYSWWLRSPAMKISGAAGAVSSSGDLISTGLRNSYSARPACNIDLDSVLFTSAAASGKSSAGVGGGALTSYTSGGSGTGGSGKAWKLTLKDSSRDAAFTASADADAVTETEYGYTDWKIKVSYSGAKPGNNEYVSALLCDDSGKILYYGNIAQNSASGSVDITIPENLAAGSYTLNIFSEQCNGDNKSDYAGGVCPIALTVKQMTPEAIPNVDFNADGADSGTLSGVTGTVAYSLNGGQTWTTVDAADIQGGNVPVSGVTAANGIWVKTLGDGINTTDSEPQKIAVRQAAKPAGLAAAGCTGASRNDGVITGVDDTMEYKLLAASAWMPVGAETDKLTGLAPGTYLVRVRASGTALASETVEVTVERYTPQSGKTEGSEDSETPENPDAGDKGGRHAEKIQENSPQTGDSMPVLNLIVLLLISGAVIIAAFMKLFPRKE